MRTLLTAALLLATPADAAAHCYSRWYYPYPQHCGRYTAVAPAALRHRADEQSHDWYVEIVKLPTGWTGDDTLTDDERRARDLLRASQGPQ